MNATEASAAGAGEPTVSATDRLLTTLRDDRLLRQERRRVIAWRCGLAVRAEESVGASTS